MRNNKNIIYIVICVATLVLFAGYITYAFVDPELDTNEINYIVETGEGYNFYSNVSKQPSVVVDLENMLSESIGWNIIDTAVVTISLDAPVGFSCVYDLVYTKKGDIYEPSIANNGGGLTMWTTSSASTAVGGVAEGTVFNYPSETDYGSIGSKLASGKINVLSDNHASYTINVNLKLENLDTNQSGNGGKKIDGTVEVKNVFCGDEEPFNNIILKNEYGVDNVNDAKTLISQKTAPNFNTVATTNEGIFKTVDDDGDVYYYRGSVDNNHVIFGNFCWKIVRTTGTGGTKLIYDGVPAGGVCNNTGTATYIKTAEFNSNSNSLAYVGYMYGEARITKSDDITAKTTNVIFSNNATYNSATDMYELDMNNSYEMIPSNWNSSNTSVNYTQVIKKHYTCLDNRTSCREVYYVNAIYSSDKKVYYQTLSNGETIDDLIDMMLTSSDNSNSSNAKIEIDTWYENNLSSFTSYLEDTIFCNDRTITSYGGWNKDNTNYDGWMYFGARNRNFSLYKPSLECPNLNDKFTVNYGRGNGDLTYPVGLLTADEMAMAGGKYNTANSSYYLYNGQYQWSLSPYNFNYWTAGEWYLYSTGYLITSLVTYSRGLRPVVSLKPGTQVSGGNGTSNTPYIIE